MIIMENGPRQIFSLDNNMLYNRVFFKYFFLPRSQKVFFLFWVNWNIKWICLMVSKIALLFLLLTWRHYKCTYMWSDVKEWCIQNYSLISACSLSDSKVSKLVWSKFVMKPIVYVYMFRKDGVWTPRIIALVDPINPGTTLYRVVKYCSKTTVPP